MLAARPTGGKEAAPDLLGKPFWSPISHGFPGPNPAAMGESEPSSRYFSEASVARSMLAHTDRAKSGSTPEALIVTR